MIMKTYGLVGKSGTGKSYQAMNVSKEKDIDYIIDDGLLIAGTNILAGKSAKREATKVGAIKTALFTNEDHRNAVIRKLEEAKPEAILVLGTSEGMILKIIDRLHLTPLHEMLHIENIASEQEIEIAIRQRKELGKHVIPVPTMQLKQHFSGYLLDKLQSFKGWGGKHVVSEKSVVRPTFSYLGDFVISDKVIGDIISHIASRTEGVSSILRVTITSEENGITIQVLTIMDYGTKLFETAKILQKGIADMVEAMTAFNISAVNIEVRGLK
jgi:uncharacterized alkaline shock family protein YloU